MSVSTTAKRVLSASLEVDPNYKPVLDVNADQSDLSQQQKRTYHDFEAEAYSLPNDSLEHHRLDIQDRTWALTLSGGLHIAPLQQNIGHVVDIGTGPARWAANFARAHPDCEVLGTDLAPITDFNDMPSNVKIIKANANEPWDFGGQKMDFIHSRTLVLGISDWDRYYQQAFEHLKPGGWAEIQEVECPTAYVDDGGVTTKSPYYVFTTTVVDAALKIGIDVTAARRAKEMMEAQGFINVRLERIYSPVGSWPNDPEEKEVGRLLGFNIRKLFVPTLASSLFPKALGWSEEEVKSLVDSVQDELSDPSKHYYLIITVCCGQKPY